MVKIFANYYASVTYQASLVEPWFVFRQVIITTRPNEPDTLPAEEYHQGTIRYLTYPNSAKIPAKSGH